jgi:hypothetical protein
MLRDASHQQVIEKFSFIHSLALSDKPDEAQMLESKDIDTNRIVNQKQHSTAQTPQSLQDSSGFFPVETATANSSAVALPAETSTIDTLWYQLEPNSDSYNLNLSEIVRFADSKSQADSYSPQKPNYLGKILFALSCSYFIFAGWWLFGHQSSKILTMLTGGQQISISKSDADFIDYMERSLSTIDRQAQANQNTGKDDEIVYVPVYTKTTAIPAVPQTANSLPTIPLADNNSSPIPQPQSTPAPLPVTQIPAPPPLPAPTPLADTPSLRETPQEAPAIAASAIANPVINHTLIGILELGDKSAALFKVQNITERIWLKEEIGDSGWILESITNQKAEISYQGKVRSVAVGETF